MAYFKEKKPIDLSLIVILKLTLLFKLVENSLFI